MTGRLQTIATHLLCLRPSPIARTHEPPSGGAPAGVAAAPQVCSEAGEALRLLRRDGAVVFQAFRDPAHQLTEAQLVEHLAGLPQLLFGTDLLVAQKPISKKLGFANNRGPGGRTRPGDLGVEPNMPHMDTAYGNVSNDYLIITNDAPAEQGGESFCLDGYRLVEGLPPRLREALESVSMIHGGGFVGASLPGKTWGEKAQNQYTRGAARDDVRAVCSPVLTTTPLGRRCLCTPTGGGIKHEDGSGGLWNFLAAPEPGQSQEQISAGRELMSAMVDLVVAAEPHAPRFTLQRGQYLVVDNYRVFHAREIFCGVRTLRRVWFWSKQARPEAQAYALEHQR